MFINIPCLQPRTIISPPLGHGHQLATPLPVPSLTRAQERPKNKSRRPTALYLSSRHRLSSSIDGKALPFIQTYFYFCRHGRATKWVEPLLPSHMRYVGHSQSHVESAGCTTVALSSDMQVGTMPLSVDILAYVPATQRTCPTASKT